MCLARCSLLVKARLQEPNPVQWNFVPFFFLARPELLPLPPDFSAGSRLSRSPSWSPASSSSSALDILDGDVLPSWTVAGVVCDRRS